MTFLSFLDLIRLLSAADDESAPLPELLMALTAN
jgi:hypothetical protein